MSTKFFDNNLVDSAVITASSENAQFPLSNIKDERRTKVYRSISNSSSVYFDFGAQSLITNVLMSYDPKSGSLPSACTIKLSNDPSFATFISTALVIDSTNYFAKAQFTTSTLYRYMKLELTAVSGFVELAKLYVGSPTILGSEIDFSLPLSFRFVNRSQVSSNRYGQRFTDLINTQKTISGSLKALSKSELEGFLAMAVKASLSKPIWILFDSVLANPNQLSGCYYLNGNPTIALDNSLYYSVNVEFDEVL